MFRKKSIKLLCFSLCILFTLSSFTFAQAAPIPVDSKAITRAEFAKVVNLSFGFTQKSATSFRDVKKSSTYYKDMLIAKKMGYFVSNPYGNIFPKGNMSRQELAVVVKRIMKLKTPSKLKMIYSFKDGRNLPFWSKYSIEAVVSKGFMKAKSNNYFRSTYLVSRAEVISTLNRCLKYLGKDLIIITPNTTPTPIPVVTPTPTLAPGVTPTPNVTPTPTITPTITPVPSATATVNLGTAGNYVILAKTGISTVPTSAITGNMGVSPVFATAITGFALTADATNVFSTSSQVTGKVYAPGYAEPTNSNLTTAVNNMETAYTDAAGRAANFTELYSGDISGRTLTTGVYKWGTDVLINTDVTLTGGANDVFVFQVAGKLTQASNTKVILSGGVQAKNIFWQVADTASIGTGAHFEGNILGMTNISLNTGASINGRLLAQTAVTLDTSIVVAP